MSGGALTVSGQEATRTDLEQSREGAYVAPTSLFGCLWALTSWYGDKPFLGSRTRGPGSPYEYMTYTEVWTMASHLGAGAIKVRLAGIVCVNVSDLAFGAAGPRGAGRVLRRLLYQSPGMDGGRVCGAVLPCVAPHSAYACALH